MEVIQLPANTARFLKTCNNNLNKYFQTTDRNSLGLILQKSILDFSSMNMNLILGIANYRSLPKENVKESLVHVKLWRMNFLLEHFKDQEVIKDFHQFHVQVSVCNKSGTKFI